MEVFLLLIDFCCFKADSAHSVPPPPHAAELTLVPLSGDSMTAESEQPLVSGNLSFTLLFASLVV